MAFTLEDRKSGKYFSNLVENNKNLILTNVVIKHFPVRLYYIEFKHVVHVEVPYLNDFDLFFLIVQL